jgi:hypothetical protein
MGLISRFYMPPPEELVRKQKALKEEQALASKAPTKRQRLRSAAAADGLPSRRDHPTARTTDSLASSIASGTIHALIQKRQAAGTSTNTVGQVDRNGG